MKINFTTRPYKKDTALTAKNLNDAIAKLNDMQQRTKMFSNAFKTTYIPEGKPLCAQKHYFNNSSGASS